MGASANLLEVGAIDVEHALEGHRVRAGGLVAGHVGHGDEARVAGREVEHRELERIERGHGARRLHVEHVAHARVERARIEPGGGHGDAHLAREHVDGLGREAAPPERRERVKTRVVPVLDVALLAELLDLALRDHRVLHVEPAVLPLHRAVEVCAQRNERVLVSVSIYVYIVS